MTFKIRAGFLCLIFFGVAVFSCRAVDAVLIGLPLIRYIDPTLIGTGVKVAQPEASTTTNGLTWEVNPSATYVAQPTNLFTYISGMGTSTNFTNSLGFESGHADAVAGNFYGTLIGVAPGVQHVDNYDANYFYNSIVGSLLPPAIDGKIVNQSFIFGPLPVSQQQTVDTDYDNYAVQYNTLFISGAGNGGAVSAPATCYNGIGVGAYNAASGESSVGPTIDNGRSKPDITAPDGATSFSTPIVSGAAAVLLQAGLRGDGGGGTVTNAASDIRTLKALLLNGAVKPSNWTHTATAPLDTLYGAGILNVFNSYKQLAAGKHAFIESILTTTNTAHPPGANGANVASLSGWDNNSIASTSSKDRVNHYYFNLPSASAKNFTLTSTLVWNRAANASAAKNLDLFLYDASNSNLVASSVSAVDNVEHIFIPTLPAGRYDLQVLKKGGLTEMGMETYSLAFQSFFLPLTISRSGTNVLVSWPLAPAGFHLQSTPSLNQPISWTNVTNSIVITNNENEATLPAAATKFFRLAQP
jgi:hypothetical protein